MASDLTRCDGPFPLVATCAFGLEAVARRELKDLGVESRVVSPGRIGFAGSWAEVHRANLWLRTVDRVLIELASFPAGDFDALFDTVSAMDWSAWLPPDASVVVTGRSVKSKLTSVPAVQRTVKKAIVRALVGDGTLDETGAEYRIDVAVIDDVATLTLDTSGRSLHARGYRTDVSGAPLKETLAAALVLLSYWRSGRPLVDPFCGSGTIVIEAAMIGRRIAPGLGREFAFERWHGHDAAAMGRCREGAAAEQLPALDVRLRGSDIDGRVLKAARDNAARAGVADDVAFETMPFEQIESSQRFGCVVTNPPYGIRLGRDGDAGSGRGGAKDQRGRSRGDKRPPRPHSPELDDLYARMPEVFRRLPTWSHYVLTAYPQFERLVGKAADRRRKLYNGRIECTYYQYHGPKPVEERKVRAEDVAAMDGGGGDHKPEAYATLVHATGGAAFGGLDEAATRRQAEEFAGRLRKRARHLRKWPTRRDVHCYRLYERDVPEVPLVIDRYEDHLHVTEYERPHDRDVAAHANWLDRMIGVVSETLEVPPDRIHFKRRLRQRGKAQHERVGDTGNRMTVREGGLRFWVNLDDYVDTGLFLDHRVTRSMVRDDAKGRRVLNLFGYTGSFSVYAVDGAADHVTTVDLSGTYLDWARDNFTLNGFDVDAHRFVRMDIAKFLDRESSKGVRYDVVVLDPPTYSNSKSTDQDWDVQRDHANLINWAMTLMTPGGVMYFSNNYRRFKLDEDAIDAGSVREITRQTIPEDFRNKRIHRCWRIVCPEPSV